MSLVHYSPELQLSVTGLLLAVVLAIVFLVPCGIIAAITNTTIGLNVVTEFIAGYLYPGLPIANIVFKVSAFLPHRILRIPHRPFTQIRYSDI